MKVIVLGGGYGTRLARDINNDTTGSYKHLLNLPKALLPVGKYPLLTHWMNILGEVKEIDHVYVEVRLRVFHGFECNFSRLKNSCLAFKARACPECVVFQLLRPSLYRDLCTP